MLYEPVNYHGADCKCGEACKCCKDGSPCKCAHKESGCAACGDACKCDKGEGKCCGNPTCTCKH